MKYNTRVSNENGAHSISPLPSLSVSLSSSLPRSPEKPDAGGAYNRMRCPFLLPYESDPTDAAHKLRIRAI